MPPARRRIGRMKSSWGAWFPFRPPNDPVHRRRTNGAELSTETRSRRSVQPAGSALSLYALQASDQQQEGSEEQNLQDEQTPNPNHKD